MQLSVQKRDGGSIPIGDALFGYRSCRSAGFHPAIELRWETVTFRTLGPPRLRPASDGERSQQEATAAPCVRRRHPARAEGGIRVRKPLRLLNASEGRTVGEVRGLQGVDAWREGTVRGANLAEEN